MIFSNKIRNLDNFGTKFNLSYKGETTYKTLGGGMVTVCFRVLILTYFCIRMADLLSYKDPEISSFVIKEDRSKMVKPYKI